MQQSFIKKIGNFKLQRIRNYTIKCSKVILLTNYRSPLTEKKKKNNLKTQTNRTRQIDPTESSVIINRKNHPVILEANVGFIRRISLDSNLLHE